MVHWEIPTVLIPYVGILCIIGLIIIGYIIVTKKYK
jgi:hypothetical protein